MDSFLHIKIIKNEDDPILNTKLGGPQVYYESVQSLVRDS